jgi:hypothetical protein
MLAARANLITAAVPATVKPSPTTRGPRPATTTTRRKIAISLFTAFGTSVAASLPTQPQAAAAAAAGDKPAPVDMRALIRAFDDAMAAGEDFEAADKAWTRAIGKGRGGTANDLMFFFVVAAVVAAVVVAVAVAAVVAAAVNVVVVVS